MAEGWGIFDCDGSENGPFQVCTFDEPELWPEEEGGWEAKYGRPYPWPVVNGTAQDEKAWEFIQARLAEGSEFHERLIEHLREVNPMEAEAILSWGKG